MTLPSAVIAAWTGLCITKISRCESDAESDMWLATYKASLRHALRNR